MLSRASQHVANLLARDSIAVAADPAAVVEVFDSYPYGEGVGEFTQANADCERIVLTESHACGAAAHAASRLREDAAPGAPEITGVGAVSYTHLDVYKRQGSRAQARATSPAPWGSRLANTG